MQMPKCQRMLHADRTEIENPPLSSAGGVNPFGLLVWFHDSSPLSAPILEETAEMSFDKLRRRELNAQTRGFVDAVPPATQSTTAIIMEKNHKFLVCAFVGAAIVAGSAQGAITFVVNAGTGADLVLDSASGTFDSEAVPPSGSANIYATLNLGPLLNSGNTNASLSYSFTVGSGDVLDLHRNSWGVTATAIYGFDILSGDGITLLYNGAVNSGNDNTAGAAGPTILAGSSLDLYDPFDGQTWTVAFTAATVNSASLVAGTSHIADAEPDRVDRLTFTAVPEPSATLLGGLGLLALARRRRA
jgi:hypothetical protein